MFGRSLSGLCNIFLHVLDHIYSNFAEIIFLDRDRISTKLHELSQAVVAKGTEVHNVYAFIDRTVRECCRPEGNERQRTVYNGHKRRHAVKYQTLVTPDGIIAHTFGPIEAKSGVNTNDVSMGPSSLLPRMFEDDLATWVLVMARDGHPAGCREFK
ncbi:hypothetical protein H257_13142 [Aphanomyces astaci]|uniref:DDE Tnp4 domain-containing protein n=1 Tax=Aphanomyces astaci TaxID=112090 RepID=W4FW60_APHAT|nr:hypothetical protein H257_13142 [Aphanomyces astaci]ETV71712.1 hypothetical protein H257_13142 [Aphanomyces astaci]|eukprot:XP_009838900.1 hypothetical protein H257_13142 [Aphanomyces astaci]